MIFIPFLIIARPMRPARCQPECLKDAGNAALVCSANPGVALKPQSGARQLADAKPVLFAFVNVLYDCRVPSIRFDALVLLRLDMLALECFARPPLPQGCVIAAVVVYGLGKKLFPVIL